MDLLEPISEELEPHLRRELHPGELLLALLVADLDRDGRYGENPKDADMLLTVGDAPRDATLSAVEVAVWSQVAGTVLASDLAILLY